VDGSKADACGGVEYVVAGGPLPDQPVTLSDVLETVRLTGALFFLVHARTPWVVEAPASDHLVPVIFPRAQHVISYHVISRGACWCESPGHTPVRLETGDVLLVPHGDRYQLASACGLRTGSSLEEALGWFQAMATGRLPFVVTEGGNGPERLEVVCGFLACDALPFNPVLNALPTLLRVRLQGDSASRLNSLIDFALSESHSARPGGRSVLLRVAELVFVEVLRSYLASASDGGNWLAGLRDPIVGRALARLHAAPSRPWTLPDLAREVHRVRFTGRSAFISRASGRVVRDPDGRSEACAPHVPTPAHVLLGADPLTSRP
jgi:hypothetical protein